MADPRSPALLAAIQALPLIEGQALKPRVDYWITGAWHGSEGMRVRLKKHVKANTIFTGARGQAALVTTDDGDELVVGPREMLFAAEPPAGAFDHLRASSNNHPRGDELAADAGAQTPAHTIQRRARRPGA